MARNSKTSEIGYSGLEQWSGQIQDDFLRELRGKEGYAKYDEMRRNSAIVGAMLSAIEQTIRGVTWQYVSEEGDEDRRVVFLDENWDVMTHTMDDHITEALSMLAFGFAPFETVYQRIGGRLMWRKFAFRGQDTVYQWMLDENGGLEGLIQRGAPSYQTVSIPIEKMVLYRTRREKNNPEGRSMLRTAWIPYYYAKNIQQIEAIGVERDLAGMPVIKLPEGASVDESDANSDSSKAAKIVRNVRNDEQSGLVLPFGWEFELASTGGSRLFDTNVIIQRYESRILMSTLSQFLILGQDRVGTQALSSDMTDFWTQSVNAVADIIATTHTNYAVKRLLVLNGMDPDGVLLEHSPAGDVDLASLGDFFMKIGDKITWLASDEVWLRGAAKLPEVNAEDIEAERELARERAMSMQQMFRPQGGNQDEMRAKMYAAGKAPDDAEREVWENRIFRLVKSFFKDEKQRILDEVNK